MSVFVCFIYRFGASAVLPKEAFSSLQELVASLSSIDGFKYNGSTEFKSANGSETCTIAIEATRRFIASLHRAARRPSGAAGSRDPRRSTRRRLRPPGLDELGLQAAIEHCADGWRARFPQIEVGISFEGDFDTLGEALNITLYRLAQEGFTNVTRHARAHRVVLRLSRDAAIVTLSLQDDGVGSRLLRGSAGLGLVGMRERVESLGGEMTITTAPGEGFGIVACFPAAGDVA